MKWESLSIISKANLIRELRFKLGFTPIRETLESALSQPTIYKQFIHRYPSVKTIKSVLPPKNKTINIKQSQSTNITSIKEENTDTNSISKSILAIEKSPSIKVKTESAESLTSTTLIIQLSSVDMKDSCRTPLTTIKSGFRWPSTIAYEANGSLPEIHWPKIGVLKAVGYSVGSQGVLKQQRLEILKNVYEQTLPYVESKSYMIEWGTPKSSTRLKKMAETLASLTKGAKRKKTANMSLAIKDWEHDLAWLKKQYYLEHRYIWVWPDVQSDTDVEQKTIEVEQKEKVYSSSREYLIEQYTNDAKELCCQKCQSALPFKINNDEYYWEETPISSSLVNSPFTDLISCPNHRAMYLHANLLKDQILVNIGDNFSKNISIDLASENLNIFISEHHQEKIRILTNLITSKNITTTVDFSLLSKELFNVNKIYLYEQGNNWIVNSRAKIMTTLSTKKETENWISQFNIHRGKTARIILQIPTKKIKKVKNTKNKILSISSIIFGSTDKRIPQSSYTTGHLLCTNCTGDGGINGGCWKCGGSGWM